MLGQQKERKSNKVSRLIALRWLDIIMYGLLASSIIWLAGSTKIIKLILAKISALELTSYRVLCFLIALMLIGIIIRLALFKPKHIQTWLRHPPILLSVVIGILILGGISKVTVCLAVMVILSFMFIFALCDKRKTSLTNIMTQDHIKEISDDIAKREPNAIYNWAQRELPVGPTDNSNNNDTLFFGYEHYVYDIYTSLIYGLNNNNNNNNTINASTLALIGDLGSGKSSIIKTLHQSMLKCAPHWIITHIDAWERNPDKLDEQILEMAISSLSDYTDVSGYRNLPDSYHNALQSQKGWWAFTHHIMYSFHNTQEKLNVSKSC